MKLLNREINPKIRTFDHDDPQVVEMEVRGRRFAFDPNTLVLVEFDEGETAESNFCQPFLGGKYKPQFCSPGMVKPQYLCLEACHCCNLACSYCFAQAYYPGAEMMSFETAKKGIDFFFPAEQDLGRGSVGFFGGEPLLNWGLIEKVVEYYEGRVAPNPAKFHVTTNATLIDMDKAKFMAEHNFSLIVSLDGPKDVHDLHRLKRGGGGSFDETMRGLELLKRVGKARSVTLRSTYTPETANRLLDITAFLNELMWDGYAAWVDVEPAFLSESKCLDPSDARMGITDEQVKSLQGGYFDVADWYVAQVRAGKKPVVHCFTKMIERLLWVLHYGTECGAGKGYFSLNASGDIFACHREKNSHIGSLHKGGINEELRCKWCENRVYNRTTCMDCDLRYVCGGGCREESIGEYGDVRVPFKVACDIKQILFKSAVWVMSELGADALEAVIPKPGLALAAERNKQGLPSEQKILSSSRKKG